MTSFKHSTDLVEHLSINKNLYLESIAFERILDINTFRQYIFDNYNIVILCVVVYLLFLLIGHEWMKEREAFEVKKPLIIWNGLLAIFSIGYTCRVIPEIIMYCFNNGFNSLICERVPYLTESVAFWQMQFTLSKLLELGDSVFLVLRKKKVITLHWFHHSSVPIIAFYFFPTYDPIMLFGCLFNGIVHSFMYSYFCFMSMGYKIPKRISKLLTMLQLFQFTSVLFFSFYLLAYKGLFGAQCKGDNKAVHTTIIIMTTYFLLFLKFYFDAYSKRKIQKTDKSK